MFSPVDTPRIVEALGRVLREAADEEQPHNAYRRSQLLSAYSVARHLAAEEVDASEIRAWFREESTSLLETPVGAELTQASIREAARKLRDSEERTEVGTALCELLTELRKSDVPEVVDLRRHLQRLLRRLADREVASLSRPPGSGGVRYQHQEQRISPKGDA